MGIINDAARYIEKGEVKIISYRDIGRITIEVKDKLVIFKKRKGRTEVTCSCQNHARFCNSPVICSHKLSACTIVTMRKVKW